MPSESRKKPELVMVTDPSRMETVAQCDHELTELWRALMTVSKGSKKFIQEQIDAMLDRRNELSPTPVLGEADAPRAVGA